MADAFDPIENYNNLHKRAKEKRKEVTDLITEYNKLAESPCAYCQTTDRKEHKEGCREKVLFDAYWRLLELRDLEMLALKSTSYI